MTTATRQRGSAPGIPGRGEVFQSLEGARGLAALLVALYHYPFTGAIAGVDVVRFGWTAVDLFFVMSGFIMMATYGDSLQSGLARRRFFLKRIGRLYPLHLVTLLAAIVGPLAIDALRTWAAARGIADGGFVRTEPIFEWSSFLSNLALVQSLGIHDRLTYNTPAWSISTEFWTYAVFAVSCAFATRGRRIASWAVLAFLGYAVILLQPVHPNLNITYDFGIFRCLAGFFLGALAAEWRFSKTPPSAMTIVATQVLAITAYLAIASHADSWPSATFLLPVVFVPIVVTLSYDVGPVATFLQTAPLRRLGLLSYSVYMVHEVLLLNVIYPVRDRIPALFGSDVPAAATYAAIVLVAAAATHRWIEVPARDWFRRVAEPALPRTKEP